MADSKKKTESADAEAPAPTEEAPPLSAELLEQIAAAQRQAEEAVAGAVQSTAEQIFQSAGSPEKSS